MALRIGFEELNISLQLGDFMYYIPPAGINSGTNFEFTSTNPDYVGIITEIEAPTSPGDLTYIIAQNIDSSGNDITPSIALVSNGSYFMFRKNNKCNLTDLTGYYLQVKLNNTSIEPAKLFSIGSNTTVNSK